MQDLKERVNDLFARLQKIKNAFNLIDKRKRIETLEGESSNPNLWSDHDKAKGVMQELSDLKKELEEIEDLTSTISGIHAGEGGREVMGWTSMLFRMYIRFCERRGWITQVLDSTDGEEAG